MKHIVIIGGGASGLVAAITAARNGGRVTVLERMQRVGKKLLATGNGRCNLTNRRLDATRYHGGVPGFVTGVFDQIGLDKTLAFFESVGVSVQEEDEGKLFPTSQQASSVLDVLRYEMEQLGITEICETIVQTVQPRRGLLRCHCGEGQTFDANRVVICTGGKSSPNLGSNGGGYKLAQALGHTIIEPFPALVQVQLDAPYLNQLAGVSIQGQGQVWVDGKLHRTERGEFLFAKYGISGTAILQLSRSISESTLRERDTRLQLDLFPTLSQSDLANVLQERIAKAPHKAISFSFVGFLHKRLIPVILQVATHTGAPGILDPQRTCGDLSPDEIAQITATLKTWTIPCSGTQSWMFSQVTAGGVDVREVDPVTLESKRTPGIHFAGEVLDIDGDSGGFNLQWAWSTGIIAGTHAALLE